MAAICPLISPDTGFVRAAMAFVDCQAQSIGAQGYLALLAPGSTLALLLTGFLTLFVALFGYRLLMGHVPDVREGVLMLAKLGFVMALATSWPAYRTLVYDVALRGPAELTAEIGVPSGLPGTGGGMVGRLDTVDQALAALAILGAGEAPVVVGAPTNQTGDLATQTPPPPFAGFNAFALGGSRLVFLLGAVGSLAAVRLTAGLMLALGPFFIAFLLFEQTCGLFEGWVRVLAGAALAAVGTAIALSLELALAEPWLADVLTRRAAGEAMPNLPAELLLVTLIFALLILALMYASARVAYGFRLAPSWRTAAARMASAFRSEQIPVAAVAAAAAAPVAAAAPAAEGRTRAAIVVDAISSAQRREAAAGPVATFTSPYRSERGGGGPPTPRDLPDRSAPAPLGQSFRRSTRTRVSASARRRDRTS
ncbi:MAG TPA: type IV secretion system protein [Allosphingosinicella sp.]|jgi:type IV secretion system protein VirB6|nr:type IV secretion system protein [Allosphingosinicella sp.]